jgi:hypothetical protein
MGPSNGNGNGNGRIKTIVVYASLAISLTALGKTVFFSGSELGAIEEHLTANDKRLDNDDRRMDRDEDRLQPIIAEMESTVQIERQTIAEQQDLITTLKAQLGKRQ